MDREPSEAGFFSLDHAMDLFKMQTQIFPELRDEMVRLCADAPIGILNAAMVTIGEAIVEDPMAQTTVTRVREVLGAPSDDAELQQWRIDFYESFKNRYNADEL